jgi:hypothetical protein
MKLLKDIKQIRKILETQEIKFTVKGITSYERTDTGDYRDVPKVLRTNIYDGPITESISDDFYRASMNINKFGPSSVTLYTYNLVGVKSKSRIKYEDVTILDKDN